MKNVSFLVFILLGALVISCQKKDSIETNFTTANFELLADDVQTTSFIDQVMSSVDYYSAIDEASANVLKSASAEGTCATVTRSNILGNRYPVTITIDFGSACTAPNGKVKSGKVIIVKSAPWKDAGATRTVSFDNHFVDGVKIEGTQKATNNGVVNGKQSFTWNGDITLTKADGNSVSRNEVRTREYIAGFDTPGNTSDDVISLSGSSTVTKSDKTTYTRVILVPLVKHGDCDFISAGVVEISKSGTEKFSLDYGNGDCDNKATVTRGEISKEIVLKR